MTTLAKAALSIRKSCCRPTRRLIREIRAQIGKLKEWIADLFKARETAPEQPPQSPNLANLLMKYLSVQREKSRKYSQRWQQQHTADELKTIAAAVNYLSEHGISTLDELDAALSSVSDKAYSIREGMKTAEQRMKELQKLMEYGRNYQTYKPIQDEYRQIRWKGKQEKFAEARRAELTLWDAANRYLHAHLPEGVKTLPISASFSDFRLPPRSPDNRTARNYLTAARRIDEDVTGFFFSTGDIYEEAAHHNAVFVGRDEDGVPRYAHQRGTAGSFRLDVKGSDKAFNFCYRGEGERLFVFEAPIDLLSFLCLFKKEWQKQSYLALGGVGEKALLLADVEQYEDFFAALEKASPVPIAFEQITNGANGYFSLTDKRIAIKEGVSELQAVKTAIHEIAHAKLHDVDLNAPPEQQNRVDRHTCEVEAESVAYTVCQHFGLDTSDYSFGYVAGWSSGKEMTELKASLETIQTTAKELITEIEGHFTELQQQRQAEQEQGDTFSIYQLKRGDETRDLRFEPYDRLQAAGLTIDRVNYELVYTAPLTKDMTLGDIWERFNIDHPADFKGHSLSVSDIVVLHQNDEDTAHYVDSIGFQQVPEFLQEQQTPVFDKLPPEQQQALSDTVQDTLQMLVDADKRIYGDVTGKTLEAIAAQGYSYKDGQLEKQQPEATPDSLLTGETVRTPRGNFHITDMSREQIEAAGFGFHHASEDGKYLIMGNGTQAYAIAAEQPQRDNPLKHVEDTIEQNDNNFDGLINNTPQTPTVADFEQRAKAGEAISVTDLAKAVKAEKREQPQKKPSILKKLDEYKKQAAQQPKDKQKEHKKDLEV